MPVVIWIHGGFFLTSSKEVIEVYGTLMANQNYVFIAMDYELAPESKFPNPAIQVSELILYLKDNESLYPMIDYNSFIIGGDSAGAHIASHFVGIQVNSILSNKLNIKPVLTKEEILSVILFCGPYDIHSLFPKTDIKILDVTLNLLAEQIGWAYLGNKNWKKTFDNDLLDVISIVNNNYPPTYITDGSLDIFFKDHAIKLENKLKQEGVLVQSYYPGDTNKDIEYGHEYQFNFKTYEKEATQNFNLLIEFLNNLIS